MSPYRPSYSTQKSESRIYLFIKLSTTKRKGIFPTSTCLNLNTQHSTLVSLLSSSVIIGGIRKKLSWCQAILSRPYLSGWLTADLFSRRAMDCNSWWGGDHLERARQRNEGPQEPEGMMSIQPCQDVLSQGRAGRQLYGCLAVPWRFSLWAEV